MIRNMSNTDRLVRAIVGVGLVVWAGVLGWSTALAIVLLVVAAILLGTAAVGFCPLYRVLRLSTYRGEATSSVSRH